MRQWLCVRDNVGSLVLKLSERVSLKNNNKIKYPLIESCFNQLRKLNFKYRAKSTYLFEPTESLYA